MTTLVCRLLQRDVQTGWRGLLVQDRPYAGDEPSVLKSPKIYLPLPLSPTFTPNSEQPQPTSPEARV